MQVAWLAIWPWPGFLAQWSPMENLEAARRMRGPGGVNWLIGLAAVLVVLAAAAVVVVLHRRRAARKKAKAAFQRRARELGLDPNERNLLLAVAKTAGPPRIDNIFSIGSAAFERAVSHFVDSRTFRSLSEEVRAAAMGVLHTLREKLGYQPGEAPDEEQGAQGVAPGTQLTIIHRGRGHAFHATVSRADPARFVVDAAPGTDYHPGEDWLVRFGEGEKMWEFNASVLRTEEGRVVLAQPTKMRFINRRRFHRVPTDRPASVAVFPLLKADTTLDSLRFVPARLVEIAGPGLRLAGLELDEPLDIHEGSKVLVTARLASDRVIEGVGVVRRVLSDDPDRFAIAVELIRLSSGEIVELMRETHAAALECSGMDEETSAATAGDGSPAGPRAARAAQTAPEVL